MEVLFADQITAIEKLRRFKVGALFMEPGTGKTRAAIELIRSVEGCDFILWLTPFQTKSNLLDEINKCGGLNCHIEGIETLSSSDTTYLHLLNLIESSSCPFIIVDESLKIKNWDAKRTKRIIELGKRASFKLVLNGTPLSKNLLDLWAQMEFLSPKILKMSLLDFKNTFCKYTKVTKSIAGRHHYTREFITGYENIDYLYSLIGHYVYECNLSLQVKQLYNSLRYSIDELAMEEYSRLKKLYLDDEMLQWKNNNIFLEMTQKMQHSYCTTTEKFDVVDEIFKTVDQSRSIIFCKYIDSRMECTKRFPKATVLSYQKESLGLNLQHLNNTIYFDKIWDYALRLQSGRRTFRTGQEYDCTYFDLTGNVGLESLIDSNIEKKIGMLEYFKTASKKQLNECL